MAARTDLWLDALIETAEPAPMLKSSLLSASAAVLAAVSLAGCMTTTPTAELRPSQPVAHADTDASLYGLFLAGRAAMDLGHG
jgi:hypothetical protein